MECITETVPSGAGVGGGIDTSTIARRDGCTVDITVRNSELKEVDKTIEVKADIDDTGTYNASKWVTITVGPYGVNSDVVELDYDNRYGQEVQIDIQEVN